jgi:hypothetical protein
MSEEEIKICKKPYTTLDGKISGKCIARFGHEGTCVGEEYQIIGTKFVSRWPNEDVFENSLQENKDKEDENKGE